MTAIRNVEQFGEEISIVFKKHKGEKELTTKGFSFRDLLAMMITIMILLESQERSLRSLCPKWMAFCDKPNTILSFSAMIW